MIDVYVRKIDGNWNILKSPDGKYPSGGYFKEPTDCTTKAELQDELEIKYGESVRLNVI